jgi:hypothetical protein
MASDGWRRATVATLVLLAGTALALRLEGRIWWCVDGSPNPWTSDAWGAHNSQHLFDPYTFTHVLHGLVLWGLLKLVAGRVPPWWRAVAALGVEAAWEVLENAPWVIDRYRAATAAVGYTGDSVMNSLGDVVACGAGLVIAHRLGWRWSAALFAATEVLLLLWIRDSLLHNVVMLLYPIDAVRHWQMGH